MVDREPDNMACNEPFCRDSKDIGRYPVLSTMWNTPVTKDDIIIGRSNRYEFFELESDIRVRDLIYEATISDLKDL